MPADVIDHVHTLAFRNLGAGVQGLSFTDQLDNEDKDSDAESYAPTDDEADDVMTILTLQQMWTVATLSHCRSV